MTRFLLLSDQCGFVDMGRPLWREDGSIVYNCCCLCQRSHSQVWVPRESWPPFTVSDLRLPQPGGPVPCIYISQEQGGPVIPPGTGLLPTKFLYGLTNNGILFNPDKSGIINYVQKQGRYSNKYLCRAVTLAIRRWLPTAAVCGGVCEQNGTGAGFLRVLRFPLSIIPPISRSS
jgi:hypothetical protein